MRGTGAAPFTVTNIAKAAEESVIMLLVRCLQ